MKRQEQLAGVQEGDVLAGKYRVDRVLGVGGMGVVVAAHHLHLDERVAIKFLLPETLTNQEAVMRFSREARAAVKIKSEHVARVTDVGTLESGAPYMVMEYLEGGDLAQWLASRGALPVEQAVDFVLQACEALAEAHAIGIVHRDLKPANLFVARLPGGVDSVKVLDFGISKLTGLSASGGQSSATKTTALMGSPLYMSPEQMQSSKDVDARGDVWALGIILFEAVTGVSPFVADTMPELILKIMSTPAPPLRRHRPDAPERLEAVLSRCLEKDRGKRYQTIGDLALALAPFGSRKARQSVERIMQVMHAAGMSSSALEEPPPSVAPNATVGTETAGEFGGSIVHPGRARPIVIAAGLVVVFAAIGIVALRSRDPAAAAPAGAEPVAAAVSVPEVAVAPPPAPPVPTPAAQTATPIGDAAPAASTVAPMKAGALAKRAPPPPKAAAKSPTRAQPPPADSAKKMPPGSSLIDDRY